MQHKFNYVWLMTYALWHKEIRFYHLFHLFGVLGYAAQFVAQLHVFPCLVPGHQDRPHWPYTYKHVISTRREDIQSKTALSLKQRHVLCLYLLPWMNESPIFLQCIKSKHVFIFSFLSFSFFWGGGCNFLCV